MERFASNIECLASLGLEALDIEHELRCNLRASVLAIAVAIDNDSV